jgi:hypothetical protein
MRLRFSPLETRLFVLIVGIVGTATIAAAQSSGTFAHASKMTRLGHSTPRRCCPTGTYSSRAFLA